MSDLAGPMFELYKLCRDFSQRRRDIRAPITVSRSQEDVWLDGYRCAMHEAEQMAASAVRAARSATLAEG